MDSRFSCKNAPTKRLKPLLGCLNQHQTALDRDLLKKIDEFRLYKPVIAPKIWRLKFGALPENDEAYRK